MQQMKNLLIVLILILTSCKNSNQKKEIELENQTITDNDIYEIVNLILKEHDKAMEKDGYKISPYKYILDKDFEPLFNKTDSTYLFKKDTIFSMEDLNFIQKQIIERKNFKFISVHIKSKEIISGDTIKKIINEPFKYSGNNFYERYHKKYGKEMFYTIGLPIFSKDKKTVFIKFDSFGWGYSLIYKKVNNKWKYYCEISNWIA